MADLAIDPTDIRPAQSAPAARGPARSRTLLIWGGVALGLAALSGGAAALFSSINLPSSLSGLAVLPNPEAPRRNEIRIGRLPDMPEIRDGVPAIVGTRPGPAAEVSSHALGPKPVTATVIPAASLPPATLPTTFTAAAPSFVSRLLDAAPVAAAMPEVAAASAPLTAAPAVEAAPAQARVAPTASSREEPRPEPAATASVPAAAVPLPPPAPVRSLAKAPDPKPERPVRPAQLATRQAAQPLVTPVAEPAAEPAPPPDDRVEILGLKLPNGRDLRDAVSSIGEALNLPKAF